MYSKGLKMEGLNIDWNAMNNWRMEPIPTTPSSTFSQESMDKAIDSLGKIGGVYTRKEILGKDPQLEAMKDRLNQLIANRDSKVELLRQMESDLSNSTYEQAKNVKTQDEKARLDMEGYKPTTSNYGFSPNDTYNRMNIFG